MSHPDQPPVAAPSPSSPSFEVGQKLAGVYVLRKELWQSIWLAHDEVLGKDVSLHFVPPVVRADERSMNELRQEIKRNRQLIHPGILRVYDLVEEPDWSAISMDWFEGQSLAALLKVKPSGFFEPSDIKPWLQQVCQTLDDIHKIQIVHRDVAPQNIIIDARGRVLLAKFGISRVIEDALARLSPKEGNADARLASMSPQLLDGETPNKADDVYSIGATIYELLTGELPFVGPDLLPQIRKASPMPMMERRAKLGRRGGTILPVWDKWVAAALAKAREERPQSAGELATKLGLTGKLAGEAAVSRPPLPAAEAETASTGGASAPGAQSSAPISSTQPAAERPETLAKKSAAEESTNGKPVEADAATAASVSAIAAATVNHDHSPSASAPSQEQTPKPPAPADSPNPSPAEQPEMPTPPTPPRVLGGERSLGLDAGARLRGSESDVDDEADLEERGGDEEYRDFQPPSSNSWPAVAIVAALIVVVGGAIYFLSRSDKPERSAARPTPAAVTSTPATLPAYASTTGDNPVATPASARPGNDGNQDTLLGEPALTDQGNGADKGDNRLAANGNGRGNDGSASRPSANEPRTSTAGDPAVVKNPPASAPEPPASVGSTSGKNNPAPGPAANMGGPVTDDKVYASLINQKKLAEAALAEADQAVQKKTKANEVILKAAEPLLAQRAQRAEQIKASEEAAQAAQKAADEKAKAVAEARKAATDWETANGEKLAARDRATAELEALQAALQEKQQQAATAAQAVASADSERQNQAAMKRQQDEEEKQRLASKAAAEEQARKAADLRAQQQQKIDEEIKQMQDRLKELQKMREQPDSAAAIPPPSSGNVPPTAATPSSTAAAPKGTPKPGPMAQATPGLQREFLPTPAPILPVATPAATVAMLTSTPKSLTPSTPANAAQPAASQAEEGTVPPGENSLGMKFAAVGDVSFCIWPVRLRDFEVFAKETGYRNNAWRSPGFRQGPDHPVVNVSWNDAVSFCRWLTSRDQKRGLLAKGQEYRLPTDLEWSAAVGLPKEEGKTPDERDMGVPDVFPWGAAWPPPPGAGNYTGEETGSDVAIKGYDDGFAWTSPVGSFAPNRFGIYDMGGNVWEWCQDNLNTDSKAKVLRGASWYNGALKLSLLSSCRLHANPDSSTDNYGFRVVRSGESKGTKAPR